MNIRITWDEYALRIATVAAMRSEDPYVQVGACALDHTNRVIGVAYNGVGTGINVSKEFWEDRDARRPYMIHAEVNLLSLFKRGDCRLIACTLLPCSSCASVIAAHGVCEVVYGDTYQRDEQALNIFKFNGISCKQIKI